MSLVDLSAQYIVVPYTTDHADLRKNFDCGVDDLNSYIKTRASQDVKRRTTTLFVALGPEQDRICGYYTLSMYSVNVSGLTREWQKHLPRYPGVPAIMLGRLAVDLKYKGIGLGEHLLMDAMKRSLDNQVAWWAMVVDSKEESKEFYLKYGFIPFQDSSNTLFLPHQTIKKAFQ
jgi:predicted GNAT family N-acyltransferase